MDDVFVFNCSHAKKWLKNPPRTFNSTILHVQRCIVHRQRHLKAFEASLTTGAMSNTSNSHWQSKSTSPQMARYNIHSSPYMQMTVQNSSIEILYTNIKICKYIMYIYIHMYIHIYICIYMYVPMCKYDLYI